MAEIETLSPDRGRAALDGLAELLRDSVASGASVGFLGDMRPDDNNAYWEDTLTEVGAGSRLLLVARAGDEIAGCVQLALTSKPNGRHRASVEKLMVHTRHRGKGLSRRLMQAVEEAAVSAGVSLLVLDTEVGSLADSIYSKLDYTRIGEIPGYAASVDGVLRGTAIYYKSLSD